MTCQCNSRTLFFKELASEVCGARLRLCNTYHYCQTSIDKLTADKLSNMGKYKAENRTLGSLEARAKHKPSRYLDNVVQGKIVAAALSILLIK